MARDPVLSDISVICLDPGGMGSDLGRRGSFYFGTIMMKVIMPVVAPAMMWSSPNGALRTPSKSAGDVLRACYDIEAPRGRPLYLSGSEEKEPGRDAKDEVKRRALWEYGVKEGCIRKSDTVLQAWQ